MKLEFGKYKGVDIQEVPEEYLLWLIDTRKRDIAVFEAELTRRETALEANQDYVIRLIKAGFRDLSRKLHPDAGGSTAEFQELQSAYEKLKQLYF